MMKVRELYREAMSDDQATLVMILDFLIKERKSLSLDDDVSRFNFMLDDKYKNKLNELLIEYKNVHGLTKG